MNAPGPGAAREVRERTAEGTPFVFVHAEWEERFAGLRCGITAAGSDADFGLSTADSVPVFLRRYRALAERLGFEAVAVPRQVHGARVLQVPAWTGAADAEGAAVVVLGEADGVLSGEAGVLLAVTAADCVPVYLVASDEGVVALLHAGWRGVAAGVLETGVTALGRRGVAPERLHLHLGPAICGGCYEVGPEVMEALGHRARRTRLDLRAELARRAADAGIPGPNITRSAWCTACGGDRFHSHRGSGGAAGRMAAYLGFIAPARARVGARAGA